MGSGGMGDVLTGVCAALIGGGHSLRDAAILGAWLCGRAAEIAIFNGYDSQESLSASSVIARLGEATRSLRNGDF
jgi:NAD(P)H-hydrate epimerase